jgi:hypothetical protein
MNNLASVLEFATYQATLTQQRKVIKQRFQDNCIFAYNGGLFQLTFNFLGALSQLQDASQWVLDLNETPIWVDDIADFKKQAQQIYTTALTNYGQSFTALRQQRTVKSLVTE